MYDSRTGWRWEFKVKTSNKKFHYGGNIRLKNDVEVVV